mgnify:CR=1 FL=1
MKFVMIKDHSWNLSKDKIILGEYESPLNNIKHTITLAYLRTIKDFNEDDDYILINNTDSIQIRPKAIYKETNEWDTKYYRLEDNKKVYFNNPEKEEIDNAIRKFEAYLFRINLKLERKE